MLRITLRFSLIFTVILSVWGIGDIGPGEWALINISQCGNNEGLPIQYEVQRQKINRTHESFNAKLTLDIDVDQFVAIGLESCKHVDGGCKPFQKLADDNIVSFLNKYAKRNTEEALRTAGVDPPEFPLTKGTYEIENFIFDYCELPLEAIYGRFEVDVYLMQGTKHVACSLISVEFKETYKTCSEESDEEE